MVPKPLALAVLGAGCVVAAASGGYVALRHTGTTAAPAQVGEAAPAGTGAPSAAPHFTPPSVTPTTGVDGTVQPPTVSTITEAPSHPTITHEPRRSSRPTRAAAGGPIARREPAQSNTAQSTAATEPAPLPTPAPVPQTVAPAESKPEQVQPKAQFEQLTIPSETVIGAQVDTTVTSERARVEDRVEGHVTRDVLVGNHVALPAGTRLLGSVTLVEQGGKFHDRARIAVRFHTAVLHDSTRVPIQTTAIVREGDSPTRESAAKVGGAAVGGAILGAILGGGKGAVIGGATGAGAGGAMVMAGGRNPATLPTGTAVSVRLMSDLTITIEE
jgi:hypothetical protein